MDDSFLREVSSQLRKPNGDFGIEVADKMNESNQLMNLKTIDLLDIKSNESILEIGMANGAFAPIIVNSAKGVNYTGLDYSADMVELAIKNNRQLVDSGEVNFITGDIHSLPFPKGIVDKIFTVNTIYFWDDLKQALDECLRVLKNNGLLAISFRPKCCLQKYPSTKFNFNYFEIEDLERAFNNHGIELIKIIHELEPKTEVLDEMIIPEFAVIVGKNS